MDREPLTGDAVGTSGATVLKHQKQWPGKRPHRRGSAAFRAAPDLASTDRPSVTEVTVEYDQWPAQPISLKIEKTGM